MLLCRWIPLVKRLIVWPTTIESAAMSKLELGKLCQLCLTPDKTSCSGLSQVMSATAIKLDDESLHVSAVLASCCTAFINKFMYSIHLK